MPILYLGIIATASFILIKGVSLFINSSTKISRSFHVSGYTISFLLVSLATSLPEAIVGITAAIEGHPILSYGNVLGSNIALLTLIIAIPCLANSGIKTKQALHTKDIFISAFLSITAVALALDGKLGRFDGGLLLVGYVFYSISFLNRGHALTRVVNTVTHKNINLVKQFLLFLVSLVLIIISGEAIVKSAVSLGTELNLGLGFIGLSIMAVGTSLPEIAYSIGLIKRHKENEVLGNVVGSVAVNSTLVLGITAMINPIVFNTGGISFVTYTFAVITSLMFILFSSTGRLIDKKEAVLLLLTYVSFLGIEYLVQ